MTMKTHWLKESETHLCSVTSTWELPNQCWEERTSPGFSDQSKTLWWTASYQHVGVSGGPKKEYTYQKGIYDSMTLKAIAQNKQFLNASLFITHL